MPRTCSPELHGRVFLGSAAVRNRLLTVEDLRGPRWHRLLTGAYACRCQPVTHHLRARAALLLLPQAVLSGRTSAVLWGVPLSGPEDDVECTVPAACRSGAGSGLRVTRRAIDPADVEAWQGLRHTTPLRTALDLARARPVDDAVVDVDRFLQRGLVALDAVRTAAADLTGRDCRHVRRVLAAADGLAESPQETRLRLLLCSAGLPPPVAQFVVRDGRGRHVARVDFAWPQARLALEYEGRWHGQAQQVARDRRRLNRLSALDWRVLFATVEDLDRPGGLLGLLHRELGTARCG